MELSVGGESASQSEGIPAADQANDTVRNLVTVTFTCVQRSADAAMTYFYGQLFAIDHEIAAMFPAAMDLQRKRFFGVLTQIARGRQDMDGYLAELGRAHRKFGVRERHYDVIRRALLATFRRYAADTWSAQAQAAWEATYDRAARIMIAAAAADAERAPAWWSATVTAVEVRAPGVAVLTLSPDQPLAFLPGQHVSVQTPYWPRQWRCYSIANAPRPDGTVRLHIRAVTGGLVSTALVQHVKVGDALVLGTPAGSMVADTRSARDVLCLAGGTGLAPVKAITEAIIAAPPQGRRREIALYYGVRRRQDLYDLADLRELELAYPWLQVIPAVSDESAAFGDDIVSGSVPELAANATWADRDIYISGPDSMIVKTTQVLRGLGASPDLIRYDLPDKDERGLAAIPCASPAPTGRQ